MTDIEDVIFNSEIPSHIRESIFSYAIANDMNQYTMILTPTSSNNDTNGSQHASNGGSDFTYEHPTLDQICNATGLGDYEYFGFLHGDLYTGHYYEGSSNKFHALVIDPPAYAVSRSI